MKKVFKSLGISGRKLYVDTNLKNETIEELTGLTPCEEVDDDVCAKILKHHGLAESD